MSEDEHNCLYYYLTWEVHLVNVNIKRARSSVWQFGVNSHYLKTAICDEKFLKETHSALSLKSIYLGLIAYVTKCYVVRGVYLTQRGRIL